MLRIKLADRFESGIVDAMGFRSSCAFVMSAAIALGGCLQVTYLAQAVQGQDELAYKARPIEDVVADGSVSGRTRAMLASLADVKAYGERYGLEPTGNYEEFVQLDDDAVVWVVSASPALRIEPITWGFPIVGSVPYLGWFSKRDAERFARELERDGYDVYLRGAGAYSTLGWFDDPVLSSMMSPRPGGYADLINTVLHESVHATVYVSSQSAFNESLADFVADTLTVGYLRDRLAHEPRELDAFVAGQERGKHRVLRMHETYLALEQLYGMPIGDGEKLAAKQVILEGLRFELGFRTTLNNATLAQARTYHSGESEFARLFEACGSDWLRFWSAIRAIDDSDFDAPQMEDMGPVVGPVIRRGCRG